MNVLINGKTWLDTDGNAIHAHGGAMLKHNGIYYWYGENRTGDALVSCYKSHDMINWQFVCHTLTVNAPKDIRSERDGTLINKKGNKVIIERPKVVYNERTGMFVLWGHYENGIDYSDARAVTACSSDPETEFTYNGSFRPCGHMSRDCTLFEDNGKMYFVSAARDNLDLNCYELTEDYTEPVGLTQVLWRGFEREAPAFFNRGGKCYALTSACTGWKPNQCKYAEANSFISEWSDLKNIGDNKTFKTQPAYVYCEGDRIIYIADRWNARRYGKSTYVFMDIKFQGDIPYFELTSQFEGV